MGLQYASAARRRRPPTSAVLPALALGASALAGCGPIAHTAGPVAGSERVILIDALAIMLAIVIPVIACTLGFAWWFRASNTRATYRPTWVYSGRLELLVWSIPLLVILFLGGIAWISSHDLDPAKPVAGQGRPVEVQVVSLDWKWLFIYPEQGVASVNHMVVPAGAPVHLSLTSASVMNVFWTPELASEIYTMNGMTTQLWLRADRAGDFQGRSGHFSGDGFSGMRFDVQAVAPDAFARWVAGAKAAGPVLDEAGYRALLPQSQDVKPFTYRAVQPGLYQAVVAQRLPPGPGPSPGAGKEKTGTKPAVMAQTGTQG